MEDILKRLQVLEDLVLPLSWVGEPVWYCNGYKDCCEYKVNRISKVDAAKFRVKVKCQHGSEWIDLGDSATFRKYGKEWIKEGYKMLKGEEDD